MLIKVISSFVDQTLQWMIPGKFQTPQKQNADLCVPADLLHKVPELASLLAPSSLANLLACNRELRHAVHGLACKVTVKHEQDLDILNKHTWSQLTIIHLLQKTRSSFPWPEHSKLECLASMHFVHEHGDSTIFIVKAKKTSLLQLSFQLPTDCSNRLGLLGMCLHLVSAIYWTLVPQLQHWVARLLCLKSIFTEKQAVQVKKHDLDPSVAGQGLSIQVTNSKNKEVATAKEPPSMLLEHGIQVMMNIWPTVEELEMAPNSELDDASIAMLLKGPFPELTDMWLNKNM